MQALTVGKCVRSRCTGKERDAETTLDYFGARYYSNALGRFITPDEPFIDQSEHDPQSWNLYAYARNNPLRFTDPDGRSVQVCFNLPNGAGQQCGYATDDDYKKANGSLPSGVVAPGGDKPNGDITCNGQVCGSVMWSPGPPPDPNRMSSGEAIPGSLGLVGDLLVFGGLRSLLGGGTRAAAGSVVTGGTSAGGRGLLTATEGVLVSNGTKAAARAVIEGMEEGAQKASLKRAIGAAGNSAKVTVQKLGDGSVRVMINRAGVDGGQTMIKTVATDGASKTVQVAVDGAGNLVHYDPKH